ncbi:UPF0394 inner membrane protein YeeE-like isoform X2 [Mercenaria mercenaria]|nr:UPF0394 inner membrane protein YeeE-like isoform X2 [Mercenaria mercenaria]XP_053387466.1 UPF0394 inner membrane protein YeeE-like isoform X2 [Mercenaria mercenaria]XP_053387467.1 UPF0394 inner membrane protein YeeE-like isoform X2 [Mercenaria mercenaria]
MHVRSRGIKDSSQASGGDRDFNMADTPTSPDGNKVADVNMKNGLPYEKDKIITNKIGDISKSPSISSQDSCTKLTIDKKDIDATCCTRDSSTWSMLKLAICFVCGIVFGLMFVYSRVFEPSTIRNQMVFENFIMLKMFLSAVCSGQIVFSVLSVLPATKEIFQEAVIEYVACFNSKGILTSAVGAFILGCGMTLSGACPGMVLAQVGSWVPNSIFTLLGCLLGALTYGLVAPAIESKTKPTKKFKYQTLHQTLKWHYIAISLPMCVVLFAVVFILEYFWDYEKDIKNIGRTPPPYDNILTAIAWRPSVAGAIIGIIQLPLVFTVHDTMGGSTSYVTVVSQWVVTKKLQDMFPYLASKRCGLSNWWQVVYVAGAILGAALASIASDTMATSHGATLQTALIGGVLMIWGARFAAGCTSGHGLSGMGLLAWLSFIAVPCMFAGGIMTGFSMQATGALDDYVSSTFDT